MTPRELAFRLTHTCGVCGVTHVCHTANIGYQPPGWRIIGITPNPALDAEITPAHLLGKRPLPPRSHQAPPTLRARACAECYGALRAAMRDRAGIRSSEVLSYDETERNS